MKIVVFAGTSEGKAVSSLLAEYGHELFVTVATEYGRCVFEESLTEQNIHLLEGRLSTDQMKNLIADCDLAVDATHPYAVEVSKNIVTACEESGRSYLRIMRQNQDSESFEDVILWAANQEEAINLMNETNGRVLLTTGSKDLPLYTAVKNFKERLFPRILPDMVSLQIAMDTEYKKKNIICMQGPFTHEVNASMLEMIGAEFLLTKETGATGGYYEKLSACRTVGAKAIVIRRPLEEIDKERVQKIRMESATVEELRGFLRENEKVAQILGRNDVTQAENTQSEEEQRINKQDEDTHKENVLSKNTNRVMTSRSFSLDDLAEYKRTLAEINTKKADEMSDAEQMRALENTDEFANETTVPQTSFENPPRFPIFLDLAGKRVTVIGSGNIARRRIAALLDYGAMVRVISPHASSNLQMAGLLDWEGDPAANLRGKLEVIDRSYEDGDLKDAVIAVAATNDRAVNHRIYNEAKERGIFVSVADQKDESSYFFPATWTGENLSVGIVGDGSNHRYVRKSAEQIREKLGEIDWDSLRE